MEREETAQIWASEFGLAITPLFGRETAAVQGEHYVLLDGGLGSFALSFAEEEIWREPKPADWSWSSDLSHHVTYTEDKVAVVRWDKPNVELFTRSSVEQKKAEFYKYLTVDRVKSNRRVVSHILEAYRRTRSLIANESIRDELSTNVFLALLNTAIERSTDIDVASNSALSFYEQGNDILNNFRDDAKEALIKFLIETDDFHRDLTLYPSLAMRHAGAEIFQEAHYELYRTQAPDLFDYVGPADARRVSRGGAHFTPASLARSLVEEVFRNDSEISSKREIKIMDPACGSGAFLHEALRTLERTNFRGKITLIGRDISPAAISMAEFALNLSKYDWSDPSKIELDLAVADSLEADLPEVDLILMNPPFVAWSAMSSDQREKTMSILDGQVRGRADLSMAFVSKAMTHLKPDGVLGTLLPSSTFTSMSAEKWRQKLADKNNIRFLGSLGDYGLFSYAMVQVGAMVLKSPKSRESDLEMTRVLTSEDSPEATSLALRSLRKFKTADSDVYDENFRLFEVPTSRFQSSSIWRLFSPKVESSLENIRGREGIVTVDSVFHVHKGVETGQNQVFVLSSFDLNRLSQKERKWFKPAVTNDSILDGFLQTTKFVFFPYKGGILEITTEERLKKELPTYYQTYLVPYKNKLTSVKAQSTWWDLHRPRLSWSTERAPKILSKRFGELGGFALDKNSEAIAIQAFAWRKKWDDQNGSDIFSDVHLLSAYVALLNSKAFQSLLSLFAPQVVGGQYDLGARFVRGVPFPDMPSMTSDYRWGEIISKLSNLGADVDTTSAVWQNKVSFLVNKLYGADLNELT